MWTPKFSLAVCPWIKKKTNTDPINKWSDYKNTCIEVTFDWNITLTDSVGVDSATRWHRSESCFRLCWGAASYKSRDGSLMCLWISTPALRKFMSSCLGLITIKYVCVLIDWPCCVSFVNFNLEDVMLLTSIQKTHFYHSSIVLHSWLKMLSLLKEFVFFTLRDDLWTKVCVASFISGFGSEILKCTGKTEVNKSLVVETVSYSLSNYNIRS